MKQQINKKLRYLQPKYDVMMARCREEKLLPYLIRLLK